MLTDDLCSFCQKCLKTAALVGLHNDRIVLGGVIIFSEQSLQFCLLSLCLEFALFVHFLKLLFFLFQVMHHVDEVLLNVSLLLSRIVALLLPPAQRGLAFELLRQRLLIFCFVLANVEAGVVCCEILFFKQAQFLVQNGFIAALESSLFVSSQLANLVFDFMDLNLTRRGESAR